MKNWLGAFAPSQPHTEVSKRPMRAMRYFKIAFCLARYRPYGHSIARVLEEILVVLLEVVRETQHLKAVAITDGPELQLGTVAVLIALAVVVPVALAIAVVTLAVVVAVVILLGLI